MPIPSLGTVSAGILQTTRKPPSVPDDAFGTNSAVKGFEEVISMWPLPSSAAIPLGNPFAGMSLIETIAIAIILVAGGIVFWLARLSRVGHELRIVHRQCPADGMDWRVLVGRRSAQAPSRIVYCSRWRLRAANCDRNCLPKTG